MISDTSLDAIKPNQENAAIFEMQSLLLLWYSWLPFRQ